MTIKLIVCDTCNVHWQPIQPHPLGVQQIDFDEAKKAGWTWQSEDNNSFGHKCPSCKSPRLSN